MSQLPLNIIFDNIGDFAIQDVAESGKYIAIDPLYCAGTPFFYDLKSRICQLGKAIAGYTPLLNQFFQMNRNIPIGTQIHYTS